MGLKIVGAIYDLEFFMWEHKITEIEVSERFPKYGLRNYILNDLEVEIVNNCVFVYDSESTLLKSTYVLQGFSCNCVKSICYGKNDGFIIANVLFKDGYILAKIKY